MISEIVKFDGVGRKKLDSWPQYHKAFIGGAIAELVDNAREAKATKLDISNSHVGGVRQENVLFFTDDGKGMKRDELRKLFGDGVADKGRHNFGVGFKSGSLSIGEEVLVLTISGGERSLGFLSHSANSVDSDLLKVPLVFWAKDGSVITTENQMGGNEVREIKEEGAKHILNQIYRARGTAVRDFAGIKREFEQLEIIIGSDISGEGKDKDNDKSGTRIVIWNLRDRDFKVENDDVVALVENEGAQPTEEVSYLRRTDQETNFVGALSIDHSIRAYLSVLYEPSPAGLKITLLGEQIFHHSIMDKLYVRHSKLMEIELNKLCEDAPRVTKKLKVEMGLSIDDYRNGRSGIFIYWDDTSTPHRGLAPRLVWRYYRVLQIQQASLDVAHKYNGIVGLVRVDPDVLRIDNGKQKFVTSLQSPGGLGEKLNQVVTDYVGHVAHLRKENPAEQFPDKIVGQIKDAGLEFNMPCWAKWGSIIWPAKLIDHFNPSVFSLSEWAVWSSKSTEHVEDLKNGKLLVQYYGANGPAGIQPLQDIYPFDLKKMTDQKKKKTVKEKIKNASTVSQNFAAARKNANDDWKKMRGIEEEWLDECIHCQRARRRVGFNDGVASDFACNQGFFVGKIHHRVEHQQCDIPEEPEARREYDSSRKDDAAAEGEPSNTGPEDRGLCVGAVGERLDAAGADAASVSSILVPTDKGKHPINFLDIKKSELKFQHRNTKGILLGEGSFAKVYKGTWETAEQKMPVAVKEFQDPNARKRKLMVKSFEKEKSAFAQMYNVAFVSEHVVKYVGFCAEGGYLAVVMELVEDASNLRTIMDKFDEKIVSIGDRLKILEKVAQGMACVHKANLIHKDLKPENVLCSEDFNTVKVTDFGISGIVDGPETTGLLKYHQSMQYSSPEQHAGNPVTYKTDVWSFGIMVLEMLTCGGKIKLWDFKDQDSFQFIGTQKQTYLNFFESDQINALKQMVPCAASLLDGSGDLKGLDQIVALVTKTLHAVPENRPEFPQCREFLNKEIFDTDRQFVDDWKLRNGDFFIYRCLTSSDQPVLDDKGHVVALRRATKGEVLKRGGTWHEEAWDHVRNGNATTKGNSDNGSPFFSFSRDFKFCIYYAQQQEAKRQINNSVIIQVDLRKIRDLKLAKGNGDLFEQATCFDLSCKDRARSVLGPKAGNTDCNFSANAKEVLIKTQIPLQAITDAYQVMIPYPMPRESVMSQKYPERKKLRKIRDASENSFRNSKEHDSWIKLFGGNDTFQALGAPESLLEESKVDSLHEPRHDGHTGFEKALMDAKGLSKEMIEQEKNHGKRGGGGQGAGKSQDAPLSLQQGGGSDSAGAGRLPYQAQDIPPSLKQSGGSGSAGAENLRVGSFNIHGFRDMQFGPLATAVKCHGPFHVLALQEAKKGAKKGEEDQVQKFAEQLGMKVAARAEAGHKLENVLLVPVEHNEVSIEGWPVELEKRKRKEKRNAVACRLDKGCLFVCTHLCDKSEDNRLKQWKVISDNVRKEEAKNGLFILGDFNALRKEDYTEEEWNEVERIRREKNLDCKTELTEQVETEGFVDCRSKAKNRKGELRTSKHNVRVDYIWASKESLDVWQISNYEHIDMEGKSDHALIFCDLSRKQSGDEKESDNGKGKGKEEESMDNSENDETSSSANISSHSRAGAAGRNQTAKTQGGGAGSAAKRKKNDDIDGEPAKKRTVGSSGMGKKAVEPQETQDGHGGSSRGTQATKGPTAKTATSSPGKKSAAVVSKKGEKSSQNENVASSSMEKSSSNGAALLEKKASSATLDGGSATKLASSTQARDASSGAAAGAVTSEAKAPAASPATRGKSLAVTPCSIDQLEKLKERCASSDEHYLYLALKDEDMELISSVKDTPDNTFPHDIICECPYSIHPMEVHEEELTRYIFTTRSPAYAVYDALASDDVRCPLLVKIDIEKLLQKETKIADFSERSKGGLNDDEKKWGKFQRVVVEHRIPACAVEGFFQIKSEEKDKMSKALELNEERKFPSFRKWKGDLKLTDQQAREFLVPCDVSRAIQEWKGNDLSKENPFTQLPADCIENIAIGNYDIIDQRILRAWKSGVPMLIIAVDDSTDYLLDPNQPHVISFPLPDDSALPEPFFLRIMMTLTDAILWHRKSHENGFIFIHSANRRNRSAALAVVALMRLKGQDFTQAKADVDKILKKSSGKIFSSKINIDLKKQIEKHEDEFKKADKILCTGSQRLGDIVENLNQMKNEAGKTPALGKRQQENLGEKEASLKKSRPAPASAQAVQEPACSRAVGGAAPGAESGEGREPERDDCGRIFLNCPSQEKDA